MTHDEALKLASGYAWGCEDSTRVPTSAPADHLTDTDGSFGFSQAYAAGWDDYNTDQRGDMIPVRDAYASWQRSAGFSIFPAGRTTPEIKLAAANYRASQVTQIEALLAPVDFTATASGEVTHHATVTYRAGDVDNPYAGWSGI